MRYRFYTCDVFTEARFGGNQLAVLPEAEGLTDRQMQQVAREFNFAETSFVFPPESGHTRKVRIFTPATEVPFAGHPNIGTAFVLGTAGEFGEIESAISVAFEEKAGTVPIEIRRREGGALWCELRAPEALSFGEEIPPDLVAAAVSLAPGDIATETHPPRFASVGLPFLMTQLKDRSALEQARVRMDALEEIAALGATPDIHLYVRSADEFDIRARMFAPLDGVPEDPATGSANCALAGLLSHCDPKSDADFEFRIAQGVELGRPSLLEARTEKRGGAVSGTWIGGSCVLVSEGSIEVG